MYTKSKVNACRLLAFFFLLIKYRQMLLPELICVYTNTDAFAGNKIDTLKNFFTVSRVKYMVCCLQTHIMREEK